MAQATAPCTEGRSIRKPSPVGLMMRPPPDFNAGIDHIIPHRFLGRYRSVGVLFDKPGKTRSVGGKD